MIRKLFLTRSAVVLFLALGAGVVAAWAASQHIRGRVALLESQARVPEVERVVASAGLPAGTRLDGSHLALRRFPAGLVSSDSVSPTQWHELEGQVLVHSLQAGDLVLPAHVRKRTYGAFSSGLASGRRAITMPVDAINSVSGLLQPGDLIDLYVSFEYQRRRITAPLLQGVLVLATGSATRDSPVDDGLAAAGLAYSTVTLDVAPEDAVKLVAAREGGTVTAVLRHPQDDTPSAKASRGDLAMLLGVNRPAPPSATRKIPVLYGNTQIRRVPGLRAPAPAVRQPGGVFEMPVTPEISSAWMRRASAQMRMPEQSDAVPGTASQALYLDRE